MHSLALVLFFLKIHPGWSLLLLVPLTLIAISICGALPRPNRAIRVFPHLCLIMCVVFFINLFVGHFARNWLLTQAGERGEAIVTEEIMTSDLYNDQPVIRYNVMIKPQSGTGKPFSSYFESDEFNVEPKPFEDGYSYPQQGTRFNVRYLPEYPQAFIIVSNDNSEYSRLIKCRKQGENIRRAQAQLQIDPHNTQYQQELAQLKRTNCNNSAPVLSTPTSPSANVSHSKYQFAQ